MAMKAGSTKARLKLLWPARMSMHVGRTWKTNLCLELNYVLGSLEHRPKEKLFSKENRTGDYFDESTHSTKPKEWCCYLCKETGHNLHDCLLRSKIHGRSKWSSSTLQSVVKYLQQYNQPVLMLELPPLCLFGKDGWKGDKALYVTTHVSFVMNLGPNSMAVPVFV